MNADEHSALDDLLDHIYEHGTTGEGVTLLAEKLLDSKRAEIERLRALLSHWYEMWNDGIPNPDGDVLYDTGAALAGKEDKP